MTVTIARVAAATIAHVAAAKKMKTDGNIMGSELRHVQGVCTYVPHVCHQQSHWQRIRR